MSDKMKEIFSTKFSSSFFVFTFFYAVVFYLSFRDQLSLLAGPHGHQTGKEVIPAVLQGIRLSTSHNFLWEVAAIWGMNPQPVR